MDQEINHSFNRQFVAREVEQSSRLPGFYQLPIGERREIAGKFGQLDPEQTEALGKFGAHSRAYRCLY